MNHLEFVEKSESPGGSGIAPGCILILSILIIGATLLIYGLVWITEQFALILGQSFDHRLWALVVAGHAMALLLFSLPGAALTREPRYRAVFRTWALVGVFALFLIPVQFASSMPAATLFQLIGATLYLGLLFLLRRRSGSGLAGSKASIWIALTAAGLIVWPWVAWGALGSWSETLLNLASAFVFGLGAAWTLEYSLLTFVAGPAKVQRLSFALAGLVIASSLLSMGATFGANGQQLVLQIILAGIGWLVAALALWNGPEPTGSNWPAIALLAGVCVAAPLLFLDPDELALILNLMTQDTGYFALRATWLGLLTGLLLGLVGWFLIRRASWPDGRRPAFLAGLVWLGMAAVYFGVGQIGWHGDRLYVILSEQADLSATEVIQDPLQRREAVYQELVGHAEATQADLRSSLEALGIDYRPYYLVNALEIDAGPVVRRWLELQPEVDRVLDSPELRPLPFPVPTSRGDASSPPEPQWNLVTIGAPQVWEELGARGAGIVIGQSDSGVDGQHPELLEQYRGNRPGGPTGGDYNWLDPWNNSPSPVDIGGHGTHTLATALGRSVGVAPDATWIGCVNLARNLGNPPRYLDCLQFHLAPFPQGGNPFQDGRPELGANVLNNSWGCPEIEGCDANSLLPAVRALRAAGVFVVASAGNEGDACGSISSPISLYDEVFTVGAIDSRGNVAPFSSRGPVTADGSERLKPDVVAPGVGVLSAFPAGTYQYSDGTSMAGPHVAGVVALMWSASPQLIGDIERTESILTASARVGDAQESGLPNCGGDGEVANNATGYGIVDAFAAVTMALEGGE